MLAIATQAIVTLLVIIMQIDDLTTIYLSRLLGYLASSTFQVYLQWYLLKQTIECRDRQWIFTNDRGLKAPASLGGLFLRSLCLVAHNSRGNLQVDAPLRTGFPLASVTQIATFAVLGGSPA